jgi:DNA-3-methyladenine glycosylase I
MGLASLELGAIPLHCQQAMLDRRRTVQLCSPAMARTYCSMIRAGTLHPVHTIYHDTEYGFPLEDDDALFERLILEINQAGLSWETILKKREGFVRAYDKFDIDLVARYGAKDVARLMSDAGIIRNRLKIAAAIENAKRLIAIREEHGSFKSWLDRHHPLSKQEWVKLFKKTFKFTGGEIVGEFLMSTGYLPGAHDADCPVGRKVARLTPHSGPKSFVK